MSPEYALDGIFSEKSDVFSFGVILLEVITGKRNTGYYSSEDTPTLVEHVSYCDKSWRNNSATVLLIFCLHNCVGLAIVERREVHGTPISSDRGLHSL